MKPVVSVELMRRSDAYTIQNKISSKNLMYKAGTAVYNMSNLCGNTAIVCGSGNNAGDGYVIAKKMHEDNLKVTLFLLSEKFSEDGLFFFEKCKEAGIEYVHVDENTSFEPYDEVLDCIFGTGFKGTPKGLYSLIIDKINSSGKRVVSVDINSGLNGDTGEYEKCVVSDLTVSIGYLKTGFFMGKSHEVIGKLVNADIGIDLLEGNYILAESDDEIPHNYTMTHLEASENPIFELQSKANGIWLRYQNIITDGKQTFILPGDINYGN